MDCRTLRETLLPLLLISTCLPAQGQIDPQKVKVFPKPSLAVPKGIEALRAGNSATQPPRFARLTGAEYNQLRATLADQLKVPLASLATSPSNAANLSTPGNVVNIPVGGPVVPGFYIFGNRVDLGPGTIMNAWGPTPAGPSAVMFQAMDAPAGTYLLTVYLASYPGTPFFSSINCFVCNIVSSTPTAPVAVQSGKLMVPFVQTTPGFLLIGLEMPWRADAGTSPRGTILACDFMRIQ